MEQYKPLKGVKVVELLLVVVSASCGRMMADWGADIIEAENTKGGNTFRRWPLGIGTPADDDFDPLSNSLNANRRAISPDTGTRPGREIMFRLSGQADVLPINPRTSTLQRSGLDYDSLEDHFPKPVMNQLDGHGEKGNEVSYPGYDSMAFWTRGGFLFSQNIYGGNEQTYPVYMPMGFGDVTCAMRMMAATMSVVLAARQTGKGDHVPLSLYRTTI